MFVNNKSGREGNGWLKISGKEEITTSWSGFLKVSNGDGIQGRGFSFELEGNYFPPSLSSKQSERKEDGCGGVLGAWRPES